MKSTRASLLIAVAAVAGILGWSVARLADSVAGRYLPITWTAAGAVWLLALSLLMWTLYVRPKLLRPKGQHGGRHTGRNDGRQDRTAPLSSLVAARTTALALASSRTGAAVGGAYAGVAVAFLSELGAPAARESAIAAGVASVGGLALIAVGLWLESMCRIDDDDGSAEGQGEAVRGAEGQGQAVRGAEAPGE